MGAHDGKVGGQKLGWRTSDVADVVAPTPGKQTLVQLAAAAAPAEASPAPAPAAEPAQAMSQLPSYASIRRLFGRDVQAKDGAARGAPDVHAAAAEGIAGPAGPLPHLEQIQRAFGDHDVRHVQAHQDGRAAAGAQAMGATAFATGDHVAFADAPSLHLAAHEAAHVVQQRGGVQLAGGVGQSGDAHERHADAVADAVVKGESAADLLSSYGRGSGGAAAVQREDDKTTSKTSTSPDAGAGGASDAKPTDTPRDLAGNERVLSKDPTYAAASYVPWFSDQVKAKLAAWDLAFDASSVSLATVKLDGAATKAIVIAWNAAWGALPTARDLPLSMVPIDARAAVAASHGLAGWAKVPSAEQGVIDGLLGGEQNVLSSTTRNHFRPTFKALKAKTDDQQATALKGLLNVKDAMPGWSAEPMDKAIATVTLAGPTEKKGFDFRGQKADAEEWTATYSDGITVKIVAPKAPTTGYHNHSVQEVAEAAGFMPKSARAVITMIMLNPVVNPDDASWAVKYNRPDFHSYMTAGVAGVVTIYPNKDSNALPNNDGRRSAMVHETAHTWSYKTWGTDKTKGKWLDWKTAMTNDKTAVSGYATADIAEDVAETIRTYVSAKGTPRFQEYERIVPHRFAILKTEYDK